MNKQIKKTIITILSAFLVFLLIVALKNLFSQKIPNDTTGVQAVIRRKNIDYLFLGSSSFRKGVNMKLLEDRLPGENVFMLTYNGNQPMNVYVELNEIINAGTDIGTLVYEIEPGMIDRGADLSDKRLLFDIGIESKLTIWRYLREREDADFFMFFDYWVSSNMDYLFTYPISKKAVSGRYYLGGNDGTDVSLPKTKEELEKLPIKEEPGIDKLQLDSLLSIMELCKNNDVELIFIEPPKYITMYNDKNFCDKHDMMIKLLDENNATYYTGDDLGFDNTRAEYYSDLSHMSEEGMNELTEDIINVLKNRVGKIYRTLLAARGADVRST